MPFPVEAMLAPSGWPEARPITSCTISWEFSLAQVAELALLPIDRFGELRSSLASEALHFERSDVDRYAGIEQAEKTERETPQIP